MHEKAVVFLSGTRKIDRIPKEVFDLIMEKMRVGAEFVVGDAPGSDKAFQLNLLKLKDVNVTVYSSTNPVRNNLGNWPTKFIDSGLKSKSNAMHAVKDRKMSEICDSAIMIWDGESAGTLANLLDVVAQKKKAFLYNFLDSEWINFEDQATLSSYLENYAKIREKSLKRLKRDRKRISRQLKRVEQMPETLF